MFEIIEKLFTTFVETIHIPLVLVILFSSILVKRLAKGHTKMKTAWVVYIWSTIASVVYAAAEYAAGTFQVQNLTEYLITYTFAASCYELAAKKFINKIFDEKPEKPDEEDKPNP